MDYKEFFPRACPRVERLRCNTPSRLPCPGRRRAVRDGPPCENLPFVISRCFKGRIERRVQNRSEKNISSATALFKYLRPFADDLLLFFRGRLDHLGKIANPVV